jgi:hypothetical protein
MKGDRKEVGEELTINTSPRSTISSRTPVLQVCGVVEFASLSGARGATALGTADAEVGS